MTQDKLYDWFMVLVAIGIGIACLPAFAGFIISAIVISFVLGIGLLCLYPIVIGWQWSKDSYSKFKRRWYG